MSENEIILFQLTRIEKMLRKQSLLNKEVLNSIEAALYLGLSRDYICNLARKGECPSFRPNNGRLYFKREDLYNWMLARKQKSTSYQTERAKLAILNQEGG